MYIADTKTYELLFLNKAGQNFFSVNFDYRGRKCYQVLQNRDFPCPFCTNSKLTQRNVYQWEFFNPIVKRHYLLKDKLIQWGERGLVRMEIALDVTDIKNKQAELEDPQKWGIAQSVAIGAQWFDSVTDVNEQLKATDALMYEDKKAYYEKHPRD